MFNIAQVLMLPTEKALTEDSLIEFGGGWILGCRISIPENTVTFLNPLDKKFITIAGIERVKAYCMYFTTDEEMREDDWCLYQDEEDIFIGRMGIAPKEAPLLINDEGTFLVCDEDRKNLKKIVATTNPDLWTVMILPSEQQYANQYIAKIPTDFIQYYVREQGMITKVELEYEEGEEYLAGSSGDNEIWAKHPDKLKLRKNGEVIWLPVKEKMYSRCEIKQTFEQFEMKYFTKYLPVEGEIKKGDSYQCFEDGERIIIQADYPVSSVECTKVKLFLCSKDIQVGDKVQRFFENRLCNPVEVLQDFGDKIQLDGGSFTPITDSKEHFFKVIGEISPDALGYVTEGDEFEEEQVFKIETMCTTRPDFYQIKGPCGHFH
jgi:hypothetical protein